MFLLLLDYVGWSNISSLLGGVSIKARVFVSWALNPSTHPSGWPQWSLIPFPLPAPGPPSPACQPSVCSCPGRSTAPTPARQNTGALSSWSYRLQPGFEGTHPRPHHGAKVIYGLLDDDVVARVVVGVLPKAAPRAGYPGWLAVLMHCDGLKTCLF